MTPVFCCGFECGVPSSPSIGGHLSCGTACTIQTSVVRSGLRALRANPSASGQGAWGANPNILPSTNTYVMRVYLRWASLPIADNVICDVFFPTTEAGCFFKQSDSKLYAGTRVGGYGATGVSITTGQWYRIDVKVDARNNPWLIDVQVDGVACGQATFANASENGSSVGGGWTQVSTYDEYVDDFIISQTLADYPIGAGKIEPFVPIADGAHNIAGTGDFQRGNTGTDILNATTTAFQLVDDVPLPTGAVNEADCLRGVAPANPTTDYVECVFGPAPGISAPTTPPRGVEVILTHHQITTAGGQMTIRLNDNGTVNDVFNTGVAAVGVVTYRYARKHYPDGPAGAWVIGGGGNGDFTDLRCRFLAQDANPDQCLDAIMIEAEFAEIIVGVLPSKKLVISQSINRSNTY